MHESFKIMGYRMSHELHMLRARMDHFKGNLDANSEEQGEHFHQVVMYFTKKQYNENMMEITFWV